MLQTYIKYFLDLLLPESCSICDTPDIPLCQECLQKLPKAELIRTPNIYALYSYKSPSTKQALWDFKFKNKKDIAEVFATPLYTRIQKEHPMNPNERVLLIPTPLSKNRQRSRGYNQSKLLCEALIAHDTQNLFTAQYDTLIKTRDTQPQSSIQHKQERKNNLKDAFQVTSKHRIQGKTIILIDDITTTHTTFNECAKALKKAGAKKIISFALAH